MIGTPRQQTDAMEGGMAIPARRVPVGIRGCLLPARATGLDRVRVTLVIMIDSFQSITHPTGTSLPTFLATAPRSGVTYTSESVGVRRSEAPPLELD